MNMLLWSIILFFVAYVISKVMESTKIYNNMSTEDKKKLLEKLRLSNAGLDITMAIREAFSKFLEVFNKIDTEDGLALFIALGQSFSNIKDVDKLYSIFAETKHSANNIAKYCNKSPAWWNRKLKNFPSKEKAIINYIGEDIKVINEFSKLGQIAYKVIISIEKEFGDLKKFSPDTHKIVLARDENQELIVAFQEKK